MRQNYTNIFSWIITIALAMFMNYASAGNIKSSKPDTTNLHLKNKASLKGSYLKSGLHLALPPLKPAATSTAKINVIRTDDKLLNDVEVFPNPITDQINIKYVLSRNALVTVKIMDVLGNEVATLLSQRIGSGEQSFNYQLTNNKLSRGFYFIRVVAGTESVIKRISILN